MNRIQKWMLGIGSAAAGLTMLAGNAFAAADAEITNAATNVATTLKENGVASFQAVIGIVLLLVVLVWVVGLAIRFTRRLS